MHGDFYHEAIRVLNYYSGPIEPRCLQVGTFALMALGETQAALLQVVALQVLFTLHFVIITHIRLALMDSPEIHISITTNTPLLLKSPT